jgi:hypothetical protein
VPRLLRESHLQRPRKPRLHLRGMLRGRTAVPATLPTSALAAATRAAAVLPTALLATAGATSVFTATVTTASPRALPTCLPLGGGWRTVSRMVQLVAALRR